MIYHQVIHPILESKISKQGTISTNIICKYKNIERCLMIKQWDPQVEMMHPQVGHRKVAEGFAGHFGFSTVCFGILTVNFWVYEMGSQTPYNFAQLICTANSQGNFAPEIFVIFFSLSKILQSVQKFCMKFTQVHEVHMPWKNFGGYKMVSQGAKLVLQANLKICRLRIVCKIRIFFQFFLY